MTGTDIVFSACFAVVSGCAGTFCMDATGPQ